MRIVLFGCCLFACGLLSLLRLLVFVEFVYLVWFSVDVGCFDDWCSGCFYC